MLCLQRVYMLLRIECYMVVTLWLHHVYMQFTLSMLRGGDVVFTACLHAISMKKLQFFTKKLHTVNFQVYAKRPFYGPVYKAFTYILLCLQSLQKFTFYREL